MPRVLILIALTLYFTCFISSCAYSLRRNEVNIGSERKEENQVQRIFIPVVDNLTQRTGIEQTLTSTLRETLGPVRGVEIVSKPEAADFYLYMTITDYSTRHGPTPLRGTSESAEAGGLAEGQSLAADIIVELSVVAKLMRKPQIEGEKVKVPSILWERTFQRSASFEASQRFSDAQGASSAPFINASRESVQIKLLAEGISQNVLDQLIQDF